MVLASESSIQDWVVVHQNPVRGGRGHGTGERRAAGRRAPGHPRQPTATSTPTCDHRAAAGHRAGSAAYRALPRLHRPEVAEFLGETRVFTYRVEGALRRELAVGPLTMLALTERLGPLLGQWPAEAHQFLSQPLLGHLERLERYRPISRSRKDGQTAYLWQGDR